VTLSTLLWLYDTISANRNANAFSPTSAPFPLFSGLSSILVGVACEEDWKRVCCKEEGPADETLLGSRLGTEAEMVDVLGLAECE
jgi:hypothetical protein